MFVSAVHTLSIPLVGQLVLLNDISDGLGMAMISSIDATFLGLSCNLPPSFFFVIRLSLLPLLTNKDGDDSTLRVDSKSSVVRS